MLVLHLLIINDFSHDWQIAWPQPEKLLFLWLINHNWAWFNVLYAASGHTTCDLPEDKGPCQASLLRWRYESSVGTCTEFIYGGCQGNRNNFLTATDCLNRCQTEKTLPEGKTTLRCQGAFTRRYNCNAMQENNIKNIPYWGWFLASTFGMLALWCCSIIMKASVLHLLNVATVGILILVIVFLDICLLRYDPGLCGDNIQVYYYDSQMGKCVQATWTGCGGNSNRFSTEADCMMKCSAKSVSRGSQSVVFKSFRV